MCSTHLTSLFLQAQVAVMPVRVAWGDQKIGLLFVVEMILSMLLMADLALSFHTGKPGHSGCCASAAKGLVPFQFHWAS